MRKISKSAHKKLALLGTAVATGLTTTMVYADSLLPTGVLATAFADVQDTAVDVYSQMIPFGIGILVAGALLSWPLRASRKAGVK